MKSVFNSLNSGLVLFTDRGHILDFSLKTMQVVSTMSVSGSSAMNDTSFGRDTSRLHLSKAKQGDTSVVSKQTLNRMPSLSIMLNSTDVSGFIDQGEKNELCFIDDNKVTVSFCQTVYPS